MLFSLYPQDGSLGAKCLMFPPFRTAVDIESRFYILYSARAEQTGIGRKGRTSFWD